MHAIDDVRTSLRRGWWPPEVRRLALVSLVTPLLAMCVGATINADVGVGPVDVATLGISARLDVAVGTASLLLGAVLLTLGALGGVPPALGTVLTVGIFGPCLTLAVAVTPEPEGAAAVAQFGGALFAASVLVSVIVAIDVGVGPPEALMLAARRVTGLPLGPLRVVEDVSLTALGVALGAPVGPGTLFVAIAFGPLVAWSLPGAVRAVDRIAPRPPLPTGPRRPS